MKLIVTTKYNVTGLCDALRMKSGVSNLCHWRWRSELRYVLDLGGSDEATKTFLEDKEAIPRYFVIPRPTVS